MADSTRAHRGPPAVVGQLADDGGGRRSTPGPCAHQARGLRFEGAAARAVVPFLQPFDLRSPARGEVQKGGRRACAVPLLAPAAQAYRMTPRTNFSMPTAASATLFASMYAGVDTMRWSWSTQI
jgi:hypothetical protein